MYNLVKFKNFQLLLETNRRFILVYQRHIEIEQTWVRNYSTKKDDVVDKLENIEQKIQQIVRNKTNECLETKCKNNDTSLPDCSVSEACRDHGRSPPVQPVPSDCAPKTNDDPCIRPYVNPCPPHPSKVCTSRFTMPVDPCREICKKPIYPKENDKKIMELDIRMMRVLLALTTLIAAYILYRLYTQDDKYVVVVDQGGKKLKKLVLHEPRKVPEFSVELPAKVPYLIVGGGTACHAAVKKLLELDKDAKILVVSKEHYFPYDRTPLNTELILSDPVLTKDLMYSPRGSTLKDKNYKSVYYEKEDFYKPINALNNLSSPGQVVCVARGWEVTKVDCKKKIVDILDGKSIKYDKCIITTGSSPRNLRVFTENSEDVKKRVSTFTTIRDYELLQDIIDTKNGNVTIAIVGGGLNGTELACSLQNKGIKVIQIYEEANNMSKLLPAYLAQWLTKQVVSTGVTVLPDSEILDAVIWKDGEHDGNIAIHVNDKKTQKEFHVFADHVLVSIGNKPNTELAEPSGLEVDESTGGFVVNPQLQLARDLYAAGDCISYYDTLYGRRHFEHYEHAKETGKTAAENIMSKGKTYEYQTLIWSDLLDDLGYEAVGTIDSSLPTVGIYYKGDQSETIIEDPHKMTQDGRKVVEIKEFNKGVIFYLNQKDTIVGILTWNVFNRAPMLRKILEMSRHYKDCDDLAKLMHIHS